MKSFSSIIQTIYIPLFIVLVATGCGAPPPQTTSHLMHEDLSHESSRDLGETLHSGFLDKAVCRDADSQQEMRLSFELSAEKGQDRPSYLSAKRHHLRQMVRRQLLLRTIDLEQGLIPFSPEDESSPQNVDCRPFEKSDPQGWAQVETRQQELQEARDAWHQLSRELNPRFLGTLLAATYEIKFIETILLEGRWRELPKKPREAIPNSVRWLPTYPLLASTTDSGTPEQRLLILYQMHPILRRQTKEVFGIGTSTLVNDLFRMAFLPPNRGRSLGRPFENLVAQSIRHDMDDELTRHWRRTSKDPDLKSLAVSYFFPDGKEHAFTTAQKQNVTAMQLFIATSLRGHIARKVDDVTKKMAQNPQLKRRLNEKLTSAYFQWKNDLISIRQLACRGSWDEVESFDAMVATALLEMDDREKFSALDAYCHSGWGQGWQKKVEAGLSVGGTTVFLGGALAATVFPPVKLVSAPLSGAMMGTSYLLAAIRGTHDLKRDAAIFDPTVTAADPQGRTVQLRQVKNGLNFVMAPLSFPAMASATNTIVNSGGWRFFVPTEWPIKKSLIFFSGYAFGRLIDYSQYQRRGLNPFEDPIFYVNSAREFLADMIMAHGFGHAHGFGEILSGGLLGATASIFVNHVSHGAFLLARGEEIDERSLIFDVFWHGVPAPLTQIAFFGLGSMAEAALEHSGVGLLRAYGPHVATIVTTILEHAAVESRESAVKLRYLRDGEGLIDAVLSLENFMDDLNPFGKELRTLLHRFAQGRRKGLDKVFSAQEALVDAHREVGETAQN